jgi:AAA ATPase domain
MLLTKVKIGPFRSINEPQTVGIDKNVTVLVGMNEAGKTVFLQALEKADDATGTAKYNPIDDYPRRELSSYLKLHPTKPAEVAELSYRLNPQEIADLNQHFLTKVPKDFEFAVTHYYDNKMTITLAVNEQPVLAALDAKPDLSSDAKAAIKKAKAIRDIPELLKGVTLTDIDKAFLAEVTARIAKTNWSSVVSCEVWTWLSGKLPKFLYFSDYDLLPSKTNLSDLAQRVEQAKSDGSKLQPRHRAVLALLRMADISIADFTNPGGYEALKAKIEGVSISLTDQILEFWKQNEDLEVEVDIKADSQDEAPYNNGVNLYLRIKNRRHRGVSTPFGHRSRGFIWFFSFLVWFDSVQHQIGQAGSSRPGLILLLDEPGLALHALAQADFLRYIDSLAERHQVIYTTHSPFMVHSDRLQQVRIVEDRDNVGTVISDNVMGSDPRTIFPLQAALGWTIAQNLFISKRNLLIEGSSELVYLQVISAILEGKKMTGLREDVKLVPVGGLDKVVTFVALLGANDLELAVLHDYRGAPEQKLVDLVKEKLISAKAVMNISQFLDLAHIGVASKAADIEDMFMPAFYVDQFNQTFEKSLGKNKIVESEIPAGDRIVERLERHLATKGIQLRPSGGFNHYAVASHFASNPPVTLDDITLKRFEAFFKAVNALFS